MSLVALPLIAALIVSNQQTCDENGICQSLPAEVNGVVVQAIAAPALAPQSPAMDMTIVLPSIRFDKPPQTWEQRQETLGRMAYGEVFFTTSKNSDETYLLVKKETGFVLKALSGRHQMWYFEKANGKTQYSSAAIGRDEATVVRQLTGVTEDLQGLWDMLIPSSPNQFRAKEIQGPFEQLRLTNAAVHYQNWENHEAFNLDFPKVISVDASISTGRAPTLIEIKSLNLFEKAPAF